MPIRQTARLSETDAAYLAGLIDGEGTIALTRLHRGQNRQLVVSVKRTSAPHHAPGLTYTVANRQALALLVQVTPHLRSYKADRARLVLDCYVRLTPRNGKYDEALRAKRSDFEHRFTLISVRRRRPDPGNCVREAARPWPGGGSPASPRKYQPACNDFTYSATACS